MKHKAILITFLSATVFAVGCKKEDTASDQIDKIKNESKETARNIQDYAYAQKSDYVKQLQSEMAALNQDLDKLSAKVEASSDAVKAEAKPKLQSLRDQAAQMNKQIEGIQNSNESTWNDVKAGSRKAYDSLKDGFQQARQWLSDKIAP